MQCGMTDVHELYNHKESISWQQQRKYSEWETKRKQK